jgi:hypothetical protein
MKRSVQKVRFLMQTALEKALWLIGNWLVIVVTIRGTEITE